MHRIDSHGATTDRRFTEGAEDSGQPATVVSAEWLNAIQDELASFVEAQGLKPSKADNTQLLRAALAMEKSWQLETLDVQYDSPQSLLISGDRAARYQCGTRVKAEQDGLCITGSVSQSAHNSRGNWTLVTVVWDSDEVRLSRRPFMLAAGPQAGQEQSISSSSVTFRRRRDGAALRDLQTRNEAVLSIEDMGGGPEKSPAQNIAALTRCFDELRGTAGTVRFERAGDYSFGDQIDLPRDVAFTGIGFPGADPTKSPQLTRLKRIANARLLNIVGTDRTGGRTGRNAFSNIGFTEIANVSEQPIIRAKWADSIVFEHNLFWMNESATLAGHVVDIEECWDWRFSNCIFKHGGLAKRDKSVLNIYNGDTDNTNDFVFFATRFQESAGVNINFDSGGRGFNNSRFWFIGTKFEDARRTKITPIHVRGAATKVFFMQTQFSGCGTRHVDMGARAADWRFSDCQFANGGDQAQEYLRLAGAKFRVAGSVFESPSPSIKRYIDLQGSPGEITGCSRGSAKVPLVGTTGIPRGCRVHHNLDFVTERASETILRASETAKKVDHGLDAIPARHQIRAWFASNPGAASRIWIGDVTASEFTIHTDVPPKTEVAIAWEATSGAN